MEELINHEAIQLSVGLVAVVVILNLVFNFLQKRDIAKNANAQSDNKPNTCFTEEDRKCISKIGSQVDDIYYRMEVDKDLQKALIEIIDANTKQTKILNHIAKLQDHTLQILEWALKSDLQPGSKFPKTTFAYYDSED